MALRKRLTRNIFSDGQQTEENTQEDDSADDGDNGTEFSSLLLAKSPAREKRRKEKANKPKEMTEEEMMDLALRLSEKEASDVAFQQEQEKEAVMKAIQESMVGQTQPCLNSPSKTDRPHRLSCRRKLSYREGLSAVDQGAPVDGCTAENDLKSETKGPGDENVRKKRKRSAGSPELEVPVSFQSQDSPCRSESVPAPLHSPQSSDSTQIDDAQLHKSPVFPLTGRNVALQIDRLKQELVDTCRSSGFVLCSQDSLTISEKSTQPRSPTFPRSNLTSFSKSPFFSEMVQGEDGETELSPEFRSRKGASPSFCGPPNWETTAFGFSSQDSLTPSVMSFCPKSPVFPRSPNTPNIPLLLDGLSASRSNGRRRRRWNDEPPMSPVFGKTQSVTNVQEKSPNRSAAGCNSEEERSHREMKDPKPDGSPRPSRSEELNQKAQKSVESEPPGQTALVWSDEDEQDEAEQTFLFSPVFPEERAAPRAEHRTASQNHNAAGSPGEPGTDSRKRGNGIWNSTNARHRPHPPAGCRFPPQKKNFLPPADKKRLAAPPTRGVLKPADCPLLLGVPFCPQGLDPDRYTQVIVAQMEVYEKSLKQAQRVLLRKAEWGEGIQPQSEKSPSPDAPTPSPQPRVPPRRGLRRRGRKTNEAVEEEENEEENDGDEEPMETDDCDVCPETQLSDDGTRDLIVVTDGAEEKHAELQEGEGSPRQDSPGREGLREHEEHGGEEMGVAMCTKTKENASGCSSWTLRDETEGKGDRRDVEETKDRGIQRSASPELESAVVPRSPTASVDCPICQASFPVSEIEMHAAYCDGEVAVVGERRAGGGRFQEVVTPRRRKRRAGRTAEETVRNLEKCYICQKVVPLSDYRRHTELCCLRPASRTPAKGNLLSALEQTERDSVAGPSGSKLQPQAVIDLRDDDDDDEEEEEAAEFRIRDSPIRSYTSISEATGCLIDFKKQQRSKKPSQKRR